MSLSPLLPVRTMSMFSTSSTSPDALSSCECPTSLLPRKPIPRKGHTKSRRGCFNCKRRRIKCNEIYPACNHCLKAGLICEYPANIIQTNQQKYLSSPSPQEIAPLQSTPGTFTMKDMRFFHHFLITAYPHLPVGSDTIWITVIPSFAHNYEYLIHSILALAASHLDAVSNANVAQEALSHRILAVKTLNNALSVPPKTRSEMDARMAAALALAFQSSHLKDGLIDFLTMIRGCNLIANDDQLNAVDSVFYSFREDGHLAAMRARLATSTLIKVNADDLNSAAMSLRQVELLLNMSDFEQQFHDTLVKAVDHAYDRPVETYTTFVILYNLPSRWTYEEFQTFIDPSNNTAQILLAHFLALQAVLTPILSLERAGFQGVDAPTTTLGWVESIYKNLPSELRHHVEWCRQVTRYPWVKLQGQQQLEYYE
ncbi:hypothetical protein GQ43DRAFT_73129 [Delitschia confertaspora ATCC 74209]|uniref:Zn(2)-C6 fungal-type domain-containing protein n=1 Tax=Delitschia confertaspora ATCC 74209 TaxID=1513339 RepID=A0A9P4JJ96_9PLEO|nr:hypothetical protein GQ43DRAFT_73129 [Delitschia confertaspora ATCC 74209]